MTYNGSGNMSNVKDVETSYCVTRCHRRKDCKCLKCVNLYLDCNRLKNCLGDPDKDVCEAYRKPDFIDKIKNKIFLGLIVKIQDLI